MDFVLNQVVELQHGHNADSHRLVERFTGFPVDQDLFPDDRDRVACTEADMGSLIAEFCFIIGNRGLALGFDPQFQTCQERCFIFRQFHWGIRFHVCPVDNAVRIVTVIAEPFSHNRMLQQYVFVEVIHRHASFAEYFGDIGTAHFIIIFEG